MLLPRVAVTLMLLQAVAVLGLSSNLKAKFAAFKDDLLRIFGTVDTRLMREIFGYIDGSKCLDSFDLSRGLRYRNFEVLEVPGECLQVADHDENDIAGFREELMRCVDERHLHMKKTPLRVPMEFVFCLGRISEENIY